MGRDKAWVEDGGVPLIARAISTVRAAGAEEIFISGRAGVDYSKFQLPVLQDLEPGFGPLGGIERGLRQSASPLLLVLAVDLPRMTGECLRSLVGRCSTVTGAVPKLQGGLEPLAAIYPRRCHEIASGFLARARRSARDFAEACHRERAVHFVPVPAANAICFSNWNSPGDLA
jgi:molybdopterin-guanine dinucleotide biosynthesis protein A